MNRSTTKKWTKVVLVLTLNFLIGLGTIASAQDKSKSESRSVSISTLEDGKIKLKVVTKNGDDQQIFEKTYDSREAMKGDEDLE